MNTQKIQAATAAVVAVRADVLLATPIPEEYFLYWEELEWFWQLHTGGHEVVLAAEVTVVHDGGRDVRTEKSQLLARNAVRCIRRSSQAAAPWFWGYGIVILWNVRLVAVDTVRTMVYPLVHGLGAAPREWRVLPLRWGAGGTGVTQSTLLVDWLGRGGIAQATEAWAWN